MKRRRVAMTLSIPFEMARDYNNLALQEAKNKSELFREMFKVYQKQSLTEDFYELQKVGAQLARKQGIFTEADVERIVAQRRRKS